MLIRRITSKSIVADFVILFLFFFTIFITPADSISKEMRPISNYPVDRNVIFCKGNCGDPNCNYPSAPLPPIHWDCPDPLPKGACRNLNCPFQPAPLRKFKTKQQLKTGPCGSPMCAYALPQPCAAPTCPFYMRPCPMAEVADSVFWFSHF